MTDETDVRAFRKEQRDRWNKQATGWENMGDMLRAASMPVSAWMVDAISPQPGHALLELAAGPGDTGFLAVELAQPGGTLISSDFAPEMLTVAQRRAEALGVSNVRFKQIDAEAEIDLPAASIDGVLCRWGYMLMADPGAALRETRRVLRPGGRLALAAWTPPEENRWAQAPGKLLIEHGLAEPQEGLAPGQFAWGPEGLIAEHLETAGFTEIQVERLEFSFAYPSFDAYWEAMRNVSRDLADTVARLPAGQAASLAAELHTEMARYEDEPGGALTIPASNWVAAASA